MHCRRCIYNWITVIIMIIKNLRFFEKRKIIFHFSNILPNPSKRSLLRLPIFETQPGKLVGPCIPLHPLFVSINHSAAELSKNGQVLGAPTVTLGAPVAATLASFLLLLFVIPLFLRFFPPFLPTSFPSLPRYFFVSRNFLNAFLRSFITTLFASLFFFLSSLTKFYPFLV